MKKILCAVIFGAMFFGAAPAQEAVLTRADRLITESALLTIWGLNWNWNDSEQGDLRTQEELVRDTVVAWYVSQQEFMSSDHYDKNIPAFSDIPERFDRFFPRADIERAARRFFNQPITRHISFPGVIFTGDGYFCDFDKWWDTWSEYYNQREVDGGGNMQGFVEIRGWEPADGGRLRVTGVGRRFGIPEYQMEDEAYKNSYDVIIQADALFEAVLVPDADGGWNIESYAFESLPMG